MNNRKDPKRTVEEQASLYGADHWEYKGKIVVFYSGTMVVGRCLQSYLIANKQET